MTEFVLSDLPPAGMPLSGVNPCDGANLALFGHDLRAALSDVVSGLRLIAPETFDPATRVQIERVRASAEALAQLMEQGLAEMLGMARTPQPGQLGLQRFLTDLDLRWSGRAAEIGTVFALERGVGLPGGLRVDRVSLDRVLSNLLGNAFKYAARGGVVCMAAGRPDGGLTLTVRDAGPGFPAGVAGAQPTPHHRPDGMTEPGSGLGLHIARDLTRRMGGQLSLRNLPTGGAEARIDLPAALSDFDTPPEGPLAPALSGKRVLVADDNPTSQAIAARLLEGFGAEVVVVGDGVAAIGRLEREAYDLLVVDVQMPRLSGLDVIRCLRKLPGAAGKMPVVAVTAYGLPTDRRAILAAGANAVLTKPLLCPQSMAQALQGMPAFASPPVAPPAPPLDGAPDPQVFEENRLQRLLDMAGPDIGQDLLNRLVSDLQGVRDGVTQAETQPDWPALRNHSHVLISLAGAVGGLRLQADAEALNRLAHRPDAAALARMMPGLLGRLDAMIAAVQQVRLSHAASSA